MPIVRSSSILIKIHVVVVPGMPMINLLCHHPTYSRVLSNIHVVCLLFQRC